MADNTEGPLIPAHTKRVTLVLANLFLYSVAMFTLPFITFFGIQHILTDLYPIDTFPRTVWSVFSAVMVVNIIIFIFAYKAYYEKEYDEHGNEIDQHSYTTNKLPTATEADKATLNLKKD